MVIFLFLCGIITFFFVASYIIGCCLLLLVGRWSLVLLLVELALLSYAFFVHFCHSHPADKLFWRVFWQLFFFL